MWSIHNSNLNTLVTKATELKLASFSCVFLLISVCRLFFFFVFVFVIVPPPLRLLMLFLLLLLLLTMSSDYFGVLSKGRFNCRNISSSHIFFIFIFIFLFLFPFIFVIIFWSINRHGNQGDLRNAQGHKDHLVDLFIVSTSLLCYKLSNCA